MSDVEIIKFVKESVAGNELNPNVEEVEGFKLKSPNGTVWYVTISDTGDLITTEVV